MSNFLNVLIFRTVLLAPSLLTRSVQPCTVCTVIWYAGWYVVRAIICLVTISRLRGLTVFTVSVATESIFTFQRNSTPNTTAQPEPVWKDIYTITKTFQLKTTTILKITCLYSYKSHLAQIAMTCLKFQRRYQSLLRVIFPWIQFWLHCLKVCQT